MAGSVVPLVFWLHLSTLPWILVYERNFLQGLVELLKNILVISVVFLQQPVNIQTLESRQS